ncbi:MAG: hypothetical protein ACI9EF_000345 [Pseudohongiellaceae bacterium]|jgi:hypothetical protein
MPSIFDGSRRAEINSRLDKLTPEHRGAFGRLTVGKMACHLYDGVRGSLGENPSPLLGKFGPLRPVLALLMIDVLPWPKGKAKTVREMLSTEPGELTADVARLKLLLERVASADSSTQWGIHPLFGVLSRAQWGRLVWRHVDYHLQQFGV